MEHFADWEPSWMSEFSYLWRSYSASHAHSEHEFESLHGRAPDHDDDADVAECWRLFLDDLGSMADSAQETAPYSRSTPEETAQAVQEAADLQRLVKYYEAIFEKILEKGA